MKGKLFCEQVLYLVHVIFAAGVSPDPSKLRVLAYWLIFTTVRKLQSFLGFMNFYSDFIDEHTALTASRYYLTAARNGTEPVHFSAQLSDSTCSSAACVPSPGWRLQILKRFLHCTQTPRKALSA